ncbi:hypothetical protein TNCV_2997421 [Trichonephila clavipes]|nr:hypothetical protein TNCV_2997421 [Trichonephila clavipes]
MAKGDFCDKEGEREERWESPGLPQGVLPQNWGGPKPNHTVICMVLKATANNRIMPGRRQNVSLLLVSLPSNISDTSVITRSFSNEARLCSDEKEASPTASESSATNSPI